VRTFSATEAKQRFAAILDAAQREPVRVQRHERDIAVVLSAEDYEHMRSNQMKAAPALQERPRVTSREFRAFLDELAADSPKAPHLREVSFDREMIYGDHD
jgi:antitoxin Phd